MTWTPEQQSAWMRKTQWKRLLHRLAWLAIGFVLGVLTLLVVSLAAAEAKPTPTPPTPTPPFLVRIPRTPGPCEFVTGPCEGVDDEDRFARIAQNIPELDKLYWSKRCTSINIRCDQRSRGIPLREEEGMPCP